MKAQSRCDIAFRGILVSKRDYNYQNAPALKLTSTIAKPQSVTIAIRKDSLVIFLIPLCISFMVVMFAFVKQISIAERASQ